MVGVADPRLHQARPQVGHHGDSLVLDVDDVADVEVKDVARRKVVHGASSTVRRPRGRPLGRGEEAERHRCVRPVVGFGEREQAVVEQLEESRIGGGDLDGGAVDVVATTFGRPFSWVVGHAVRAGPTSGAGNE
jgi:hypothetical protein